MTSRTRRNLLKGLTVSAPAAWTTPLVQSIILPAHAQTSPCGTLECFTNDPISVTAPEGTELSNIGNSWGWSSFTALEQDYRADITGLRVETCPGTQITMLVTDESGDGRVLDDGGQTVVADASGVASFTEEVWVFVDPGSSVPVRFTLGFTSSEDSCEIPFCFTEFGPQDCFKEGP